MIRRFHDLANYNFVLEHISGAQNNVADFLSRYGHGQMCSDTDKAIQTSPLVPQSSTSTVDSCVNKVSIVSGYGELADGISSILIYPNPTGVEGDTDVFNLRLQ